MTTTFTFDKKTVDVIDKLKVQISDTSRVEVVRRALAFLDLAVESCDGKPVTIQTVNGLIRIAII